MDNADQSQPGDYKSYVKPKTPPCDGMQFARNPYDSHNYLDVGRDAWDNERPTDRLMHDEMQMGDSGSFGGRQYAEFQKNSNDGYGVEILDGQSAAFNTASTVYVDVSRADRGAEFVESNDDSGQTGPSRPYSDSNSVARGNTPAIISYLNSIRGRK